MDGCLSGQPHVALELQMILSFYFYFLKEIKAVLPPYHTFVSILLWAALGSGFSGGTVLPWRRGEGGGDK